MTKTTLAALAALALVACGNEAPPPKPAVKSPPPAAAKPAPAPEAKAPAPAPVPVAAPAPDPNKELAARVRKALEQASLQAGGVDVTASGGVVSLFGTVPTSEEKRRAATIAGKVEGVKSIENKLVVVSGS